MNQLSRNLALWLLLILMVLLLVNVFTKQPTRDQEIVFSDFLTAVEKGEVSEVTIQGQEIQGKWTSGEAFRTFAPEYADLITTLQDLIADPSPLFLEGFQAREKCRLGRGFLILSVKFAD